MAHVGGRNGDENGRRDARSCISRSIGTAFLGCFQTYNSRPFSKDRVARTAEVRILVAAAQKFSRSILENTRAVPKKPSRDFRRDRLKQRLRSRGLIWASRLSWRSQLLASLGLCVAATVDFSVWGIWTFHAAGEVGSRVQLPTRHGICTRLCRPDSSSPLGHHS